MLPYKPTLFPKRHQSAPSRESLGQKSSGGVLSVFPDRAYEFVEPLKFLAVTAGWVGGDMIGHQLFETTRDQKTPAYYYGNKALWAIPFLLVGRLLSDHVIKGSQFARAATIGTTANILMQIRYLLEDPAPFNLTVFAIHEALLLPLSLLITGPSPATGKY